jgi:hypothetical protein
LTGPATFPLLDAFQELQRRGFSLGVDEYVLALRALAAGFGEGSREDLLLVCQALWATSAEESEQVVDVLKGVLPPAISQETINALDVAASEAPGPMADGRVAGDDVSADQPPRTSRGEQGPGTSRKGQPDGGEPGGVGGYFGAWPSPSFPGGGLALADPRPAPRTWQLNPRFDFLGTLPVTKRRISQAWRHYRRMGRSAQRTDFDADATVAELHRHGVLLEPVLIPRRTNQARLLMLEDVGGSMVPFRYVTKSVVGTAQHVGLARVDVRYFHDVPRGLVFRDPEQRNPVTVEEAAAPFTSAGILVYSDAGAARGSMDHTRLDHTAELLVTLRRYTAAIAWLNPVPRHRWAGTTAEAICDLDHGVPMFPLDHYGLADAIDVLRGRRH